MNYSVGKALKYVMLSCIVVVALFFGSRAIYAHFRAAKLKDPRYTIVAITSKSRSQESVPHAVFSDLMNLSYDEPSSMYAFDTSQAAKEIYRVPTFKKVKVQLIKPGIVSVDYELRQPVAELLDYENRAVDKEGVDFPMLPYITPKNIPRLYLGALENRRLAFAFELMELARKILPKEYKLALCDVSQHFLDSSVCEIDLQIDKGNQKLYARLSSSGYSKDFESLVRLLPALNVNAKEIVVDLRVAGIGLVYTS